MTRITPPATTSRRRRRLMAVGAVATGLSLAGAGAGAAMAATPASPLSRAVAGALHDVGVDWSAMPDGYTQAQYEAFWGAGYTYADAEALSELWNSDITETKSQAGQMILDGTPLPIAPGETEDTWQGPDEAAQYQAFWDAGYTSDDLLALSTLWNSESSETKARAGQMILDGQTPPVAPSDAPVADTAP